MHWPVQRQLVKLARRCVTRIIAIIIEFIFCNDSSRAYLGLPWHIVVYSRIAAMILVLELFDVEPILRGIRITIGVLLRGDHSQFQKAILQAQTTLARKGDNIPKKKKIRF